MQQQQQTYWLAGYQTTDNAAIKLVTGSVTESQQLTALPFDHIFYTGGENAAKAIMASAAENLTPVTLELGGKSPR